ncbi:MAG: hypothetical protein Q4C53_06455 [Clostridia bacterium]|nr:hypothetical protein [Clostridia bacterium]
MERNTVHRENQATVDTAVRCSEGRPLPDSRFRELTEDPFYRVLRGYPGVVVDYVLLKDSVPYAGLVSHRRALAFAMDRINARRPQAEPWRYDVRLATATAEDTAELLAWPEAPLPDSVTDGGEIPYWMAFARPPHCDETADEGAKRAFETVNAALFPKGTDALTAVRWSTDWSDYFDAGHEWWGTACVTVYDIKLGRFAVLLMSSTD